MPATVHASSVFLLKIAESGARALVLGCFAALMLAGLRVKSVLLELLVWRGVLIAALAMPLLGWLTPAVRLPLPLPGFERQNPVPVSRSAQSVAVRQVRKPSISPAEAAREAHRVNLAVRPGDASSAVVPQVGKIAWPIILATAYSVIVFLLIARVFVGARWGKRLERVAKPIEDFFALRALAACARTAQLGTIPRLAESPMSSVPLTLGARNPVILLPADWRSWEEGELESVLAHEVSHVARRDALVQRLALIHRAIFWFSPLAWWLERHLVDLAEQASDEAALACGADRTRYAEMLLGFFAALEALPGRVWWPGVSLAKAGQAERRVDRILAWRGAMSNKLKKSLVVGLAAVAAPAVVLMAAVHPDVYNFQEPALAPVPPEPASAPPPHAVLSPVPRGSAPPPALRNPYAIPAIAPGLPTPPQAQQPTPLPSTAPRPVDNTITVNGGTMTIDGHVTGRYDWDDWGPRFVIVSKNSNSVTMSGTEEDARHARSLRSKNSGDFIWFESDEKSYIIRDQATVDRAKKLWEPQEELGKKQEELGKQQEALGRQQEELGEKMEQVRVKIPDMSADLQALAARMKELSTNGGTQEEIGELQGQIGELQSRVGEIQSVAGRQQSEIGRQQSELGRKQGELGRRQGELGRQQGELAKQASREMRRLLEDAIAHGLAQPE